jgi:hypothetical protein
MFFIYYSSLQVFAGNKDEDKSNEVCHDDLK